MASIRDREGIRAARRRRDAARSLIVAIVVLTAWNARPAEAKALPLSRDCAVPDALLSMRGDLDRVARRIGKVQPVRILTVGSASDLRAWFPARTQEPALTRQLERRFPRVDFRIHALESYGETASDVLDRLKRRVVDSQPDLVIWQAGTTDALEGADPVEFSEAIEEGVLWMARRAVDVILMDSRYFPRVAHEAAYRRFSERLGHVARDEDVPLMRRYHAMRHWAEKRPSAIWTGASKLRDRTELCVAEVLAEGIARRVAADWRALRQRAERRRPLRR